MSVEIKVGSPTALLTIIFVTLKLVGFIAWSWVWVLSPLWIGASLAVIVVLVAATAAAWASRLALKWFNKSAKW